MNEGMHPARGHVTEAGASYMFIGGDVGVEGLKGQHWNFLVLFEMYKEHGLVFAWASVQ